MLVTFRCQSYSSVTMFGEVALQLIKMMGHSATVPGSLAAQEVPVALDKLTTALKQLASQQPDEANSDDDEEQAEPIVGMSRRAYPLIELLKAAINNEEDVMWEA